MASTSSADSHLDDVEIHNVESPFLKEFQLAAKQLEELAQHASAELPMDQKSCHSDIVDTISAFSIGWVPVSKREIQADPKGTLEVN